MHKCTTAELNEIPSKYEIQARVYENVGIFFKVSIATSMWTQSSFSRKNSSAQQLWQLLIGVRALNASGTSTRSQAFNLLLAENGENLLSASLV